jgi:prepilin signal peptidase PulO-like enzyme (type II secretory pathway)
MHSGSVCLSGGIAVSGVSALVCLMVLAMSLIAASVCDIRTHTVPDLIWWVASLDILALLIVRYGCGEAPSDSDAMNAAGRLLEALFIIFIQERVMSRYYGRADSHAFSCCALYFAVCGTCLEAHILHMTLSLISLTAIQLLCHNINRRGRLKQPAPFIPYISITFIMSFMFIL